jgi:hypothetical protein
MFGGAERVATVYEEHTALIVQVLYQMERMLWHQSMVSFLIHFSQFNGSECACPLRQK